MNTTSMSAAERTETPIGLHVRWMIRRDLPECLHTEDLSRSPWQEENFLAALRQRNCVGLVVERGGCEIVGHLVFETHPKFLGIVKVEGSLEGRIALLRHIAKKLSAHRRTWAAFNCHELDDETQRVLAYLGWQAVGVFRSWFSDDRDAYRFILSV